MLYQFKANVGNLVKAFFGKPIISRQQINKLNALTKKRNKRNKYPVSEAVSGL